MESQLEFPKSAILTPYNYFEWKPKIQLHLRSRGLFRITMETEVEPTSAIEKSRYFNRMDEAFGILCLSISPEMLFHVESCSTPNEVWKLLERLFGKQDEIWQSFLFSLGHFDEDILHAPVDELVTKFPSPLIDEYADETSDQHSDDDESLFEEDPQALLAMEPSMPMHAYMMHECDPQTYAEANTKAMEADSARGDTKETGSLTDDQDSNSSPATGVAEKPHLLDCMKPIVSPFLETTTEDNRPDQPLFQKVKRSLSDCVAIGCGIFISHPITSGHRDFLDSYIDFSRLQMCIRSDIIKLENQIPLSVLRNVFDSAKYLINESHRDFNQLLQRTCKELSPFNQAYIEDDSNKQLKDEPHLLGSMHALVSPFLQMQDASEMGNGRKPTLCEKVKHLVEETVTVVCSIFLSHPIKKGQHDFLNAYNAGQLAASEIKFKSFSRPPYLIRFDKYSDTLYLPRISVSHVQTEVFLRNMVALEFNDAVRLNYMTRYVGLMDCLIDTPDDVRLLRGSHFICRRSLMLTDEYIADMWNRMCQPFFTGHLEFPEELKLTLQEVFVQKYFKSRSLDSCEIG